MAGTVLFLVFVGFKMTPRIACGTCCGARDQAAAERDRVLVLAALLYKARASNPNYRCAKLNMDLMCCELLDNRAGAAITDTCSPHACRLRLARPSPASSWRPTPSPYTSPTLAPPEAYGSPPFARSPGTSVSHSPEAAVGASPWSRSSPSPTAAAALAPGQRSRGSSPKLPRPTVRDLVRAWTSFGCIRGNDRSQEATTAAAAAAAAVEEQRVADLEAQQQAALSCQLSVETVARALTWSQLGVSAASSRRTSENTAPLRRPPLPPVHLGGEVHNNPVYAARDWATTTAAAIESGTSGSFSMLRRAPSHSRLSRPASFVHGSDPLAAAAAAVAVAGEGSAHDGRRGSSGFGREGSSHPHSRPGSFQHGSGGMTTRLSEQSLLQLGRIKE